MFGSLNTQKKVKPNNKQNTSNKKNNKSFFDLFSLFSKKTVKIKPTNDPYSLKKTKDKVSFYIPYHYFFDDNKSVIALKNNGLMKVFEIINQDLTYVDNINDVIDGLNNALKQIDNGLVLHYETRKTLTKPYNEEISEFSSLPTVLTYEKRKEIFEKINSYDIRHFVTISYFPDFQYVKDLDAIVATSGGVEKKDYLKQKRELLKELNMKVNKFISVMKRITLNIKELNGDELMDFLYRTINPIDRKVKPKAPPVSYPLDEYLSSSQMIFRNGALLIDKTYVKAVSIRIFADSVIPQFFSQLENFDFQFRMVNRFIGLSRKEALTSIKRIQAYQRGKRFGIWEMIQNALFSAKRPPIRETDGDITRVEKVQEAEYAEYELKRGAVSYGYYTFSFLVYGKSFKEVEDNVIDVINYIDELGFTCVDDKLNTNDVYFGAMPANIKQNIRKSPIDSKGLSDLLPISSLYEGNKYDKKIGAPNLFTTVTDGKIFYFNNKVGEVGHTIVFGKTGYGKSVFLLFMIINFLKYKYSVVDSRDRKHTVGSQVFVFDKGGTSKVLTYLAGGQFYDLGNEEDKQHMAFQPLRHIDKDSEMEFALDWVIEAIRLQDANLADKISVKSCVSTALESLSKTPEDRRTISNLMSFITSSDIEIKSGVKTALKFYTNDGPYGTYFDNVVEEFANSNLTTFEVGNSVENNEIFSLICDYLFHVIENKLSLGIPTMIVLDEVHNFFKREIMSKRIVTWLKELRKKNATLVMATQEINDVKSFEFASTIKSQVPTKIFLPDAEATEENMAALYREYGLTNESILMLKEVGREKQRRYLYTSLNGYRMFDLQLSELELCFLATDSKNDQNKIENLHNMSKEKFPDDKIKYLKHLNKSFLRYKYNENKLDKYDLDKSEEIIDAFNYNAN